MSTTINLEAPGRDYSGDHRRWADQVRVYDPQVDSGAAIVVDLKARMPSFTLLDSERIAFAFLTKDEAVVLARAIIREAHLSREVVADMVDLGEHR